MTLHVGFTGTRDGMTFAQEMRAYLLLLELGATDLHHGDCIGSDDQIDQIGCELGLGIYLHPPSNPQYRAWCNTRPHDGEIWILPLKPYLTRNKEIVRAGSQLIATPKEASVQQAGGTWSTVRFALGIRPVWIVWPDGTLGSL